MFYDFVLGVTPTFLESMTSSVLENYAKEVQKSVNSNQGMNIASI